MRIIVDPMKTQRLLSVSSNSQIVQLEELKTREGSELKQLEVIIQGGLKTFFEVGQALGKIRDKRLYRGTHTTFEAYCRERWEISRVHAHRLVAAAEVRALLAAGDLPLPETEGQIRALAILPKAEIPRIWASVVSSAGSGRVTAKLVGTVLRQMQPRPCAKLSKNTDDENWQLLVQKEIGRMLTAVQGKNPDDILCSVEKIKLIVEELVLLRLGSEVEAA
jgi:hypothetical protein